MSEYTITVPASLTLDRTGYLELYYFMVLNRKLEDRLEILYRQNKVVGSTRASGRKAAPSGARTRWSAATSWRR
jgi:TPP-dependent pyruvate/acetoin dehydrogenase alpha subunit